jgi:hypothetical protein
VQLAVRLFVLVDWLYFFLFHSAKFFCDSASHSAF